MLWWGLWGPGVVVRGCGFGEGGEGDMECLLSIGDSSRLFVVVRANFLLFRISSRRRRVGLS